VSGAAWSTWALAAAAALCNALAQLLMKKAHITNAGDLAQWLAPAPVGSLALYGVSFVLTALVFARLPLSVISPLMAGAIFVLISLFSTLVLGESLSPLRWTGMALILAGIALLTRSV
jgi:multidrug transporter EmrE-like cation transporter